jgi:hypothetical protein
VAGRGSGGQQQAEEYRREDARSKVETRLEEGTHRRTRATTPEAPGRRPSTSQRARSASRVRLLSTRAWTARGCSTAGRRTGRARAERDATLGRDRCGSDDAERGDGRSHLDCWRRGVLCHQLSAMAGDGCEKVAGGRKTVE